MLSLVVDFGAPASFGAMMYYPEFIIINEKSFSNNESGENIVEPVDTFAHLHCNTM